MTIIVEAVSQQGKPTARQLGKLRARLVRDLEETRDLIAQLAADLESMRESRQDVATDDEHDPEGPTLAFERSQSTAILGNAQQHLHEIESALERVDGDEFGVCIGCGQRIPFARLDARPYARRCVACAELTTR
ncbi:MAG: TraR/DksA C4-type zinc finger protein [Lacisediminihabitans sp.]